VEVTGKYTPIIGISSFIYRIVLKFDVSAKEKTMSPMGVVLIGVFIIIGLSRYAFRRIRHLLNYKIILLFYLHDDIAF